MACRTCSGWAAFASGSRSEKLRLALDVETEAIERLNRGIALCTEVGDNGSREVAETILAGEEEHADWLETQLELIRQVGEAHYLAQQIGG
jgi:bacterioferritin